MPSEVMDRRRLSPSPLYAPSVPSSLSDEIRIPMEKQMGFWKPASASDLGDAERLSLMQGSGPVDSSLLDNKVQQYSVATAKCLEPQQPHFLKGQKVKLTFQDLLGAERINGHYDIPLQSTSSGLGSQFDPTVRPAKFYANWSKADLNNVNYEQCTFSGSLSASLNKKVNLNSDDRFFGNSIDTANSNFEEDEIFESIKEMEAHTIGNLLPDDDELLDYINQPSKSDDVEEDIFCTVGGIEIEEAVSSVSRDISQLSEVTSKHKEGESNSSFAGEHPYDEHPSRTLFVRNINSNVEDAELGDLFQQYGDVRSLYTACKHRGFVVVSYYDIRSACNAMAELQNKPLGHRKLDIHFSIPKDHLSKKDINKGTIGVFNVESSVSNNDLYQIFGVYGGIKEIRDSPNERHHKFIEFYDVRAAEAALYALDGIEIGGKRINLEPAHSRDILHSLTEQAPAQVEQSEIGGFHLEASSINSPTEGYGTASSDAMKSTAIGLQAVHRLQSVSRAPFNLFEDRTFNGLPSSGSRNFPPTSAFVGNHTNQSARVDLSHSPGERNFHFDHVPNFHPHSLPEYHDHIHQNIPQNSANYMSVMGINIARSAEHVENRYTSVASSGFGSRSFQHTERATGALGNGSYPVYGQFGRNNNSVGSPSGPVVWANSPSFGNNIPSPPLPQLHGFSRTSHMLNSTTHGVHHVGSAPTANLTLWNRRHAYAGDPTETSVFHPSSLGTMGFPGSPTLNHVELVSHNIFPHVGRNFMEPPVSLQIGFPSAPQSCHIFNCRNDLMTMPAFDASSDRVRSRRNDINSAQADNKKQYELDVERIIKGEDSRTTLMIKNIPNKYTSKMLLAAIDEHHRGSYDFIYLPIDFKNKCNVGYAFINMINAQQIIPFHKTFNGKKWEKFNSEKVASLAYARIQGKTALIAHFQNSSLMNEDKRCRPILFHSGGPNAGDQEPFPIGGSTRSRPGRSRNHNNDDHHHDVSLSSKMEEESSTGVMISSGIRKDL